MAAALQAARITDPVTHGLGLLGIVGGMLIGAVAGAILIAALPVTAPALVIGLTAATAVGAVAGGGLAGHQLLDGIQRACGLSSPQTGIIGVIGSPNVRIASLPAARVIEDRATACSGLVIYHLPIPPLPSAPIAEGAQTIRINNLLAARVSSKTVCGASIQRGAMTVYYGGPTQRVLAVFDLESMLQSALGFVVKASLVAAAVLTLPLGIGAVATLAVVVGGFMAVNYGLGQLGRRLQPGWGDMMQGSFGLATILGGAQIGVKELGTADPIPETPPELPPAVLQHIFEGDSEGGYHSTARGENSNVQVLKVRQPPDANGVYKVKLEIHDPETGGVITKDSTMFPDSWSEQQVLDETHAVMKVNPPGLPNAEGVSVVQGTSPSGVPIRIIYQNGVPESAYPVHAKDLR